jgi:hypothetical protein
MSRLEVKEVGFVHMFMCLRESVDVHLAQNQATGARFLIRNTLVDSTKSRPGET